MIWMRRGGEGRVVVGGGGEGRGERGERWFHWLGGAALWSDQDFDTMSAARAAPDFDVCRIHRFPI